MNIKELKELAQKATPGPWKQVGRYVQKGHVRQIVIQGAFTKKAGINADATVDAEYVAAANPQTLTSLIERYEQLFDAVKKFNNKSYISNEITGDYYREVEAILTEFGLEIEL